MKFLYILEEQIISVNIVLENKIQIIKNEIEHIKWKIEYEPTAE